MNLSFNSKAEDELKDMAQARWKEAVETTNADKLLLQPEIFIVLRQYFQIGYEQGMADIMLQMKEIYHDDVDLFQAMFEDAELN